MSPSPTRLRLAVVGVGNTLAGDDGIGPAVVRRLRAAWDGDVRVRLVELEGDLYELADLVPRVEHLLFVDAVAGGRAGEIVRGTAAPRAAAPSLHQTDIGTVMAQLRQLGVSDPFPEWEIVGVVVRPPLRLVEGLSPAVAAAADELVGFLDRRIHEIVDDR